MDNSYLLDTIQDFFLCKLGIKLCMQLWEIQTMTEAEHNRPNPKLFGNRPSALAAELFCETIRPIVS